MRNWRRHLITLSLLIFVTIILGPLGLGEWIWSKPRHMTEQLMVSQTQAGDEAYDKEMHELRESLLLKSKEVADLQARLLSMKQSKELTDNGTMEIISYDARVTSRTRGQREQYVEINRGALEGVRRGMAVCAGRSLLGLVIGEHRHSSLVRLISDPQSHVAAHIYDGNTRLEGGVLVGAKQSGMCEMKFIEDRAGLLIEPEQYIVSAGTDGIVPEGLILGIVVKAERGKDSDNWQILVQPLRPIHAVTEVIVSRRPIAESEGRH